MDQECFFLMKGDIPPIWETGKNIGGGMWTFKVPKKSLDKIWIDLIAFTLGNTLTKNPDDMKHINGISISPKINNCIDAVENGVRGVVILDGRRPRSILHEIFSDKGAGTLIRK